MSMKNLKLILMAATAILIVGWAIVAFKALGNRNNSSAPASAPASNAASASADAPASATWLVIHQDDSNDDDRYILSAAYPAIQDQAAAVNFNTAVEKIVQDELQTFRIDAAVAAESAEEGTGSMFQMDYAVVFNQQGLFSMYLHKLSFIEGSQRPGEVNIPINYDLKNNRPLALADLFSEKADYLTFLSEYCTADLKTRFNEALNTTEGLAPAAENFAHWNLTPGGIEFTFSNFQLGLDNATGEQSVLVPYSALKSMIQSNGPLGWAK